MCPSECECDREGCSIGGRYQHALLLLLPAGWSGNVDFGRMGGRRMTLLCFQVLFGFTFQALLITRFAIDRAPRTFVPSLTDMIV